MISDRQNPSNKQWVCDIRQAGSGSSYTDYAIISRVKDPSTGRVAVLVAGISGQATLAAGEFASNPKQMEAIARQGPRDWRRMNMQVVLTMKVSEAKPGPPQIVAAYFW